MRFRSTIVLLLLFLGLGAYVYWVEVPKAQLEAQKKTLFKFKPGEATQVSLVYADRAIVLKKSGGDWQVIKPLDAPADQTTVKNLLHAVANCEIKKTLKAASKDLSPYGLDKPLVKVTVQLKNKTLPTVLVGNNTPVGFSTYIKKDGDKDIIMTSSAFRSGMDKTVTDVRNKTIVSFQDKDVHKIILHRKGEADITLSQKSGSWRIESPGPYAADANAMRSLLSSLRSMRAVDFPAPPKSPADYGFDAPRLVVHLYLGKDNAEKTLTLGKDTDKKQFYVEGSGQPATIYLVNDWAFRDLDKHVNDLRDKTVLAFDRDKVTAVDIKRQDGSAFKLVRGSKGSWSVAGASGTPLTTTINSYLSDLHSLRGYSILADHPADLSTFGLDKPLLTLAVIGEKDKDLGTVLIAKRPSTAKAEYTAMAQGGPTVFQVRDYLVTRLDKQAKDFVEAPTPTPTSKTAPTPTAKP